MLKPTAHGEAAQQDSCNGKVCSAHSISSTRDCGKPVRRPTVRIICYGIAVFCCILVAYFPNFKGGHSEMNEDHADTLNRAPPSIQSASDFNERPDHKVNLNVTGCKALWSDGASSIWDLATFKMLQDTYRTVVPRDKWSIFTSPTSGLMVPFEIRQTPGKGRGIYATAHIPKGTEICNPVQHAVFPGEASFRHFLSSLTWELACDILQWAYVEEAQDHEYMAVVELDPCSLMNHAPGDGANTGPVTAGSDMEFQVALRDIGPGEELVEDYSAFDNVEDNLPWFTEIFDQAYDDEEDPAAQ